MNRIEEMIKEMCPDGVRRVKLGEVCNSIKTGKLNANAMDSNGLFPFFLINPLIFGLMDNQRV